MQINIELFIFTLSFMIVWIHAEPVKKLRDLIVQKTEWIFLKSLVQCNQCSSFWIAILCWFLFPIVPGFLIFAIHFYATFVILEEFYFKYID